MSTVQPMFNIIIKFNMNQSHYEPMDVDLSSNSNAMEISYNSSSSANDIDAYLEAEDFRPPAEPALVPAPSLTPISVTSNTPQPTHIKKFRINMQKEKKSQFVISLKAKIICSVVVLLLSTLTYQVLNIKCSDDINPDDLKSILSAKVFGQSQAINSLIESLHLAERSKILFFYGGTGVGKTLTASLVLEHIGQYSNVYHYVMPSFTETFTTDCMIGLSVCKHTTVIVDDLTAKDFHIKSHIEDLIMKSQSLDKDITIILIFNCDDADKDFERNCNNMFEDKVLQNFKNIDAFKKLIKFDKLNEEHLKLCIETELRNKKISNTEFEKIVKNFNVSLDGCKGVYTKIKMLELLR